MKLRKNHLSALAAAVGLTLITTACGGTTAPTPTTVSAVATSTTAPAAAATDTTAPTAAATGTTETGSGGGTATTTGGTASSGVHVPSPDVQIYPSTSSFFNANDWKTALTEMNTAPTGPSDQPWLQSISPKYVDTSKYKKAPPWNVCFSNAGVFNPWRVNGFTNMQQEVKLHPEIANFTVYDAQGKDDKQIADINDALASGKCDLLIVSPNTTQALTPAVEKAAAQIPTIVFDRGVATDAPVTFISPIGGYAFGAPAAQFIADNLPQGGNVLALRIAPGVDVLETRWAAAEQIFEAHNIKPVGVEFTGDDRNKAKSITNDYLDRSGKIDAIWMDAGDTATAVLEAFQERNQPYPIISGEDQQDFLTQWQSDNLKAIAPTYPTFQWRTAIIAATMILSGQQVPKPWVLPEPTVTQATLSQYISTKYNLPPQFYAMCGCQNMPTFPQAWGGSQK